MEIVDPMAKWDKIMNTVLVQGFDRTLGTVIMNANIREIYRYAVAKSKTIVNGKVRWVIVNYIFKWENIRLGEDLYVSYWIYGFKNGMYCFIMRDKVWRPYIIRSKLEAWFGLPYGTLALRDKEEIKQKIMATRVRGGA